MLPGMKPPAPPMMAPQSAPEPAPKGFAKLAFKRKRKPMAPGKPMPPKGK